MEITKDNFVSARFCDNERTQIEVFVKGDKKGEVFPHIIELDENHPDYKNLISITTLPEIHDYTDRWCNEQRKRFKEEMINIAKQEGIIKENKSKVGKSGVKEIFVEKEVKVEKSFTEILEYVFSTEHDYNSEQVKEQLFKAKLYAFEMAHIKDSDSRDLKAKLRKSETIKEVFKIISQF